MVTPHAHLIAALDARGFGPPKAGNWRCPAHADRTPSLSVSEGTDGRALLKCFAGCTTGAVIEALDLELRDLFESCDGSHLARAARPPAPTKPPPDVAVIGPPTSAQIAALKRAKRITKAETLESVGAKLVRVWGEEWLGLPNLGGGWKVWALDRNGNPRRDDASKLVRRNVGSVSIFASPDLLRRNGAPVARLFDVEGESDALACIDCGMTAVIATTGGAGTLAGHKRHAKWLLALKPAEVVVIGDLDDAGRDGSEKRAKWWLDRGVAVRVPTLPEALGPKGDVRDFLLVAALGGAADLDALADAAELRQPEAKCEPDVPTARLATLSSIERRDIAWLWEGRIPRGKISIIDGDPGLGKSHVTLDLAGRVSKGLPMPDGSAGIAGAVLLLTYEDDAADTVRPRVEAAGADLDRVHMLSIIESAEYERMPDLPADLALIEQAIIDTSAVLVVVDPIMAALGGKVDSHRDQDVRRVLSPLSKIAERTGAAVLLVRHLNKGSSGSAAIYRGGGSIGIIGAARSGLLVARDPEDPDRRVLAVTKSNLTAPAPALGFKIVEANGGTVVEWLGIANCTADQLVAQPASAEERSALDDAREFLCDFLAVAPRPAGEVRKAAGASGIAEPTLRRAKAALGVKSKKASFGDGWVWSLPSPEGAQETPRRSRCSSTETWAPSEKMSAFDVGELPADPDEIVI